MSFFRRMTRKRVFFRNKSYCFGRILTVESLENRLLLSGTPAEWFSQGPGPTLNGQTEGIADAPVVGAIHTVAAHPTDADTLYIGAVNGGIWKTTSATNANPNWVPLTDFESSLSIGALEYDPTDGTNQTLVAGMGRFSSFGGAGGARNGLLRTTNDGATWTALNGGGTLVGANISGVAARGSTIVVAANQFAGVQGLFRSTNTGGIFTLLSNDGSSGLPAGGISDLVGDPGDPTRLYASVIPTISQAKGAITTQGGIYRSDDTGATWTNVTDAGVSATINAAATLATNGSWNGVNNIEMAVHDNSGGGTNAVYVGVVLRGQNNGFFRSADQGGTWTAMDIPQTNEGGTPVDLQPREKPGSQGATHFSMVADPTNEFVVYVGGDRQAGPLPNSLGASDWSGRLFRGDANVTPTGAVPSPQWTSLTHSGTVNNSAPHADSREMVFDVNGNIVEVDDGGI